MFLALSSAHIRYNDCSNTITVSLDGLEMADSFSKLFCCLYIVATFLCSLVIAAESSTCVALPYGNELKDDSTVCSEFV